MDIGSTGAKRSRNDDPQLSDSRQQRHKRQKYTLNACNGCKKQKIKCSGGVLCQRCERHGLQCVYSQTVNSASDESNSSVLGKLQSLETRFDSFQTQADQMYNVLRSLEAQSSDPAALSGKVLPSTNDAAVSDSSIKAKRHQKPQFEGRTSSAYSFRVGKSSLEIMGIQANPEQSSLEPESCLNSPRASPRLQPASLSATPDPLKQLGLGEALRLLSVYKDELDGIYPFLDVSNLGELVHVLYKEPERQSTSSHRLDEDAVKVDTRDTDILKIVFAQALTVEGLGSSVLAERMVESVDRGIIGRQRTMRTDLKDVQITVLQSIYYFHCDEEVVAWRTIGFAVRLALEMGLHRKESLLKRFPDAKERSWATKIFWCVYVLDRRWSFGTGMPFALHQYDIDPELPEPDDSSPYLQKMVSYGRINTRVWKAVNGSAISSKAARKDDSENLDSGYIDFQIQQWQRSIPEELQLIHPNTDRGSQFQPRSLHRLRVLLYLRANQMRILIFRHHLLNTTSINKNRAASHSVVDVAKDTIQVLAHLHRTSNIYHTQQVCFNYFLVLALATLFLAVCHSPAVFSDSCRAEFYLALELVKGFSSKSLISQRLWKTIRDLRHIGPKIGLTPTADQMPTPSPSSYAASRVPPEEHSGGRQQQQQQALAQAHAQPLSFAPGTAHYQGEDWVVPYDSSEIGNYMSYALTDLFEAAGGNLIALEDEGRSTNGATRAPVGSMGTQHQYPLEDNEDVSRLLGDLMSWDNPQFI